MTKQTRVAGIEVSKSDKELFPRTADKKALTKLGLAEYYADVATVMLLHLRRRPVNMQRLPDGITGPSFYEKKLPSHFPTFVASIEVNMSEREARSNRSSSTINAAWSTWPTRRASPRTPG